MIAISTAFKRALIGADIDGKIGTCELDSNCKHSENILPSIDATLEKLGKKLSDNDCYAVVLGPGSFTGIRIGISLVKGFLAGGGQKKLIGITTNELIAYTYIKNFAPQNDFFTVIDALSGLFYISKFSSVGKKIENERLIEKSELLSLTGEFVGLAEEEIFEVKIKVEPSSEDLLNLAKYKQEKDEFIRNEQLVPLYLRKSQAEVNLEDEKLC